MTITTPAAPPTDLYRRTLAHLGFAERAEQTRLVDELRHGGHRVVQAGTGTGKSLAALTCAAEIGSPGRPATIITMTNALTRQYVEKDAPAVAAATGMTFTRVIGRSWMLCASSKVAKRAYVPQEPEPVDAAAMAEDGYTREEIEEAIEEAERECRDAREVWLARQVDPAAAPAVRWEWREDYGQDETYGCPGGCRGARYGGCGAVKARERARRVDVVITNAHCATYQELYPLARILPTAVVTIVDEAHQLPGTVADILEARIGPGFGQQWVADGEDSRERALRAILIRQVHALREQILTRQDFRRDLFPQVHLTDAEHDALTATLHGYYGGPAPGRTGEEPALEQAGVLDSLYLLADTRRFPDVVAGASRSDRDTLTVSRADVSALVASMLGGRAALISGTVPGTLAARCGWPGVETVDVGHPFDYRAAVTGRISRYTGSKTPPAGLRTAAERAHWQGRLQVRYRHRAAELDSFIGDGQALVLCPSHADVAVLDEHLVPRLHARGLTTFLQPRGGGSQAALAQAAAFRDHHERRGGGAVLIGTDSLVTGVDLPGAALTRVAWWCVPIGASSAVDRRIEEIHRGYLEQRCRIKVAQGIGRLIRSVGDVGEVLLCDQRFIKHLEGCRTVLDRHLGDIEWRDDRR